MAIQVAIFLLAVASGYSLQPLPWRKKYTPRIYLWLRFARMRIEAARAA